MTTVLLIRHGRTPANVQGVLAGRSPGVHLDPVGREQVAGLGRRLADVPLVALVTSPLQRCRQTAQAVLAGLPAACPIHIEQGLTECGYGEWTGRRLADLSKEPLWATVQSQPSAVRFPGGESMVEMAARAVGAIRRWDAQFAAEHGPDVVWAAFSHGDVIKAIVADALGMHLDSFQRILVDPTSVSVVRYTANRPYAVTINSTATLPTLVPDRSRPPGVPKGDAPIGGGLGADEPTA